jgi:hypothetical protein
MKMNIQKHAARMLTLLALAAFSVTGRAQTASVLVVDDFSPNGVSPSNPTNLDWYTSTNVYSSGYISNVWWSWFGNAFSNIVWDSTMDASNNPSSGSLKITLNWNSSLGGNNQFLVWDQGVTNNYFALNLSGYTWTNFQCDVKFAPGSASDQGSYGYLQFGTRGSVSYGVQDYFVTVNMVTNNAGLTTNQYGWVHISSPMLNPVTDPNLTNIQDVLIHIYGPYGGLNLNGPSTLWVDNIKFYGMSGPPPTNPPPILGIESATPGLRIFAGSAGINDRSEVATADRYQSWIGATHHPVSYSFTLLSYPSNIGQTHIFLVPVNSMPGGVYSSYNGIDYTASNGVWLVISPFYEAEVTAAIYWKTNLPNANAYAAGGNTALRITNSTAIGTWTLSFNSDTTGTLTAPGASPVSFTITNGTVATDFANPLIAYFGLQPNVDAGIGQYEDWASISVTNVAGDNYYEDFTHDLNYRSVTQSGNWVNMSVQPVGLIIISTNDIPAYWLNWTVPAGGQLGSNTNLLSATPWINPAFYDSYYDETAPFGNPSQFGSKMWEVLPKDDLPTVDGSSGGVLSPTAFFLLSTNVLSP